ncbi:MAG: hypothetical protein B9S32_10640 [Verrucomicrobia bacterium Tous-C9LFEB]|nr:MAG: hypothetical protein B9S32_10640 [Verrucomicrobia bacterium Tous-C9LFEB]
MSQALITAVSGMTSSQTAMDVIGNNIANSNTVGFKNSRTDFVDAVYQANKAAGGNGPTCQQVGLGDSVAATPLSFAQGTFESTGITTDLAINGSGISSGGGFFVVSKSTSSGSSTELTRAGDFTLNSAGYLVTQDGYYVMGSANPFTGLTTPGSLQAIQIPATIASTGENVSTFSVGTDGTVTAVGSSGGSQVVGYLGVASYVNPQGLASLGNNRYAYTAAAGDAASVGTAGEGAAGTITQGALEVSNVDLANEFTQMITTQRAFDANSKIITTANEMLQTAADLKQ